MRYAVPLGRVLYALIFILSGVSHFSAQSIGYAASAGVPMAGVLVPISGVLALIGGLMVALGFRARIGAWLLIAFLVPVTVMMHAFWAVDDPQMAAMQRAMFLKNVAMMGGALLLAYWGAGPVSVDSHRRTAVHVREPLPT